MIYMGVVNYFHNIENIGCFQVIIDRADFIQSALVFKTGNTVKRLFALTHIDKFADQAGGRAVVVGEGNPFATNKIFFFCKNCFC